jgi:ribosomal protein L21E
MSKFKIGDKVEIVVSTIPHTNKNTSEFFPDRFGEVTDIDRDNWIEVTSNTPPYEVWWFLQHHLQHFNNANIISIW